MPGHRFRALLSCLLLLVLPSLLPAAEAAVADPGHTAWVLTSCALVLFMTLPGLALFYGGIVRTKNVLSVVMQCFALAGVMSIIWVLFGYSLAFTEGATPGINRFIGGFKYVGLLGMTRDQLFPGTQVPELAVVLFQMTFFIITPGLIVGGFAERMKFSAMLIFSVIWSILVYLPICHMAWGGGLFADWGMLDLAGGTVVHITAGIAALVAAIMVGKRKGYPKVPMKPHSLVVTAIGTGMLWVGWFGFNGGSPLSSGGDAAMAMLVSQISAATAALTWMAIEWIKEGKPSALGILTGVIAGLATITPASGNVGPLGAIAIGACAGIGCYLGAVWLKHRMGWDDSLDAFGVHGVGGMIGTLLVGVFCWATLGGTHGAGGTGAEASFSLGRQVGVQALGVLITAAWSGLISFAVLFVLKRTVGLRVAEEVEDVGLDLGEHGELGYDYEGT